MSTENADALGGHGEGGATYLARREADVSFPPDRTALLVIDPVNDFLSEGGAGWEMTKNTVKLHDGEDVQKLYDSRSPSIHEL